MINAVGREIPEEILKQTGKEVFQGNSYRDGKEFQRRGPKVVPVMNHDHSKLVGSIHEALVKCGAHDGMTVSFHHHFRDGDLVVCQVMKEIHKMGFKMAKRRPRREPKILPERQSIAGALPGSGCKA